MLSHPYRPQCQQFAQKGCSLALLTVTIAYDTATVIKVGDIRHFAILAPISLPNRLFTAQRPTMAGEKKSEGIVYHYEDRFPAICFY